MGNRAEAVRQKKARNKGFYASDISECKYKYGGATWHAWMDGYHAGLRSRRTKDAPDLGESSASDSESKPAPKRVI